MTARSLADRVIVGTLSGALVGGFLAVVVTHVARAVVA